MRIIFFGTPFFAAEILAFLLKNKLDICAVVTQPDRKRNRLHISEVKQFYQKSKLSLAFFQPIKASEKSFIDKIKILRPDLVIVAAYGQILKPELLKIPKYGFINVHTSLLPTYRGAAPMQRTLLAGETQSGVTIMQMNEKMDEGDILQQGSLEIPKSMNFGQLQDAFIKLSGPLLLKTVQQIKDRTLDPKPQDHAKASYAPKIKSEEYWMDWHSSAEKLHNQVRAFAPFPGARCWIWIGGEKKQIKILKSCVVSLKEKLKQAGEILQCPNSLQQLPFLVACQKDALQIDMVKPEGKKTMSAADFFRGLKKNVAFVSS